MSLMNETEDRILVLIIVLGAAALAGIVLIGIPWLAWFLFTHLEWVG